MLYYRLSYNLFICIALFWDLFFIQITCIGRRNLRLLALFQIIYFHKIRAIAGRLEKSIKGLPPPYRLNIPKLALVTSSEARCQLKPPNYSINWTIGQNQIEIINSFTGKTVCNKYSRVTKQNIFHRFARIISQLPNIPNRKNVNDYADEKACVADYQVINSRGIIIFISISFPFVLCSKQRVN